jgi:outer membrane protein
MKPVIRFFSIALILLTTTTVWSQSTAFLNSSRILASMPEVKEVQTQLQDYESKLKGDLQFEINKLQTKYNDWQKSLQSTGQQQAQQAKEALDKEKQQLFVVEQSIPGSIQQKQQGLMKPVYEKVNALVAEIAKEKGYTLVLDTGTGSVVYGDDKVNITQLVIDRLKQ